MLSRWVYLSQVLPGLPCWMRPTILMGSSIRSVYRQYSQFFQHFLQYFFINKCDFHLNFLRLQLPRLLVIKPEELSLYCGICPFIYWYLLLLLHPSRMLRIKKPALLLQLPYCYRSLRRLFMVVKYIEQGLLAQL